MPMDSRSTSEDRLPFPSAPVTAENVNENHRNIQYRELRALLNTKD